VTVSISRLGAGDGYTYLTNSVAKGDGGGRGMDPADYYLQTGNPAGRWMGSGAEVLGVEGTVSTAQMHRLYGLGLHPDTGTQLGRRYQLYKTIAERIAHHSADELGRLMEAAGLPFAPIRKPEDLFDDEHLLATGGLADVRLPDGPKAGQTVKTTLFPITMDGQRLGVRLDLPRLGEHSRDLLTGVGYAQGDIDELLARSIVA